MKETVFITGITGFIGTGLATQLSKRQHQIIGLSRHLISSAPDNIHMLRGDILKPESYATELQKCDVLYHCAAFISFRKRDFDQACRINVEGTRTILEAAHLTGVKKVVHVSAGAVLGYSRDKTSILDEESNPVIDMDNVYAYSKKLAEAEVHKYVKMGLNVSIANPVTVYGSGDASLNSGAIIKSIYECSLKAAPPGGTSYVSVHDLAVGLMLLAEKGKPGERYVFCMENISYVDLIRRIAAALSVKPPRITLPVFSYLPALWALKIRERLNRSPQKNPDLMTAQILKEVYGYKYFNSDKARKKLGWEPKISLEEAVKEALAYYLRNNLIQSNALEGTA